uniref:CSON004888 protein n=2 Tax=Culicoides sonorensis TaxID=179676 RepID=A0A336LUJ2_CULSO
MLIGVENCQDVPQSERLHLPPASIDTKATQELLDYIAETIDCQGPQIVFSLFHAVTSKFPQEQWFRMFKTPNDLSTFLKLFSDCFQIQSDLVVLLHKPKLSDTHIKHAQAAFTSQQQQQSTANNKRNKENNGSGPLNGMKPTKIGDFKLNEPVSGNIMGFNKVTPANNASEPNSGFDSLITEVKLENLCANNCPIITGKCAVSPQNSLLGSPTSPSPPPPVKSGSVSERLVVASNNNVNNNSKASPHARQTLKQRINSLVIKTISDNLEKDKHSHSLQSQQQQQLTETSNNNRNSPNTSPIHSGGVNHFNGDTWRIKILQNTRVIATVKESLFVTDALLKQSKQNPTVISVDCEGINLGVRGQLTLIEIGTTRGEAFMFDLMVCPELVLNGGLKALMESENVIKVIHDCRNDSINLYTQFGIKLRNVFDTQSAHAVLQCQESGKPVYKVKNLSLNNLCEIYNAPINPMKDHLKNIYRRDQKYWARRPLTKEMILYAAGDVLVLINDQLYAKMAKMIKPEFRQLFSELCTEQILMLISPNEVKCKKKQRKINYEIQDLKAKLQRNSKNIVLSNREIRLLRYLDLTEEEKEKLKGSYKVAKKLEKLESFGQDRSLSDSEDEIDGNDQEYPSLDSVPSDNSSGGNTNGVNSTLSPSSSEPPSITESMLMMNDILSDKDMDRHVKIDKLEAILSAVSTMDESVLSDELLPDNLYENTDALINAKDLNKLTKTVNNCNNINKNKAAPYLSSSSPTETNAANSKTRNVSCQTYSTGDIISAITIDDD